MRTWKGCRLWYRVPCARSRSTSSSAVHGVALVALSIIGSVPSRRTRASSPRTRAPDEARRGPGAGRGPRLLRTSCLPRVQVGRDLGAEVDHFELRLDPGHMAPLSRFGN